MIITELNFIAYFQGLAEKHRLIAHGQTETVDGLEQVRNSFIYIPSEFNLAELDNMIRSGVSTPLLMVDALKGHINDNGTDSHHQDINVQFFVLEKTDVGTVASIREARDKTLPVGMAILERMKSDRRKGVLLDKGTAFTFNNVGYDPIGPIETSYYGYSFQALLRCPFAFKVDGGTWSDIPAT
jgi:hypothetical protein